MNHSKVSLLSSDCRSRLMTSSFRLGPPHSHGSYGVARAPMSSPGDCSLATDCAVLYYEALRRYNSHT